MRYDTPEPARRESPGPAQTQMTFAAPTEPEVTPRHRDADASTYEARETQRGETAPPAHAEASTEPAAVPATPAPRPPRVELPTVSLALPAGSDLVLVETSHPAPPVEESEPVDAAHPRRVRPPRVEIPSEPLELVETRKDSSPAQ